MSLPITVSEATDETTPETTKDRKLLLDLLCRVERLEEITGGRSRDVDTESRTVMDEMIRFLRWLETNNAFAFGGHTHTHIVQLLERADAVTKGRQARFEGI